MARPRLAVSAASLLALALTLAAAGVSPAAGDSQNLLLNPGFEEGVAGHPWMPTGWDTSRAGIETVFFGRDSYSARTGQYGVNVASASNTIPFAHHWSQTVLVTPDQWGKDLVFSIWTRNNGVDGRGYVLLQAYQDTISKMARVWGESREDAGRRLGMMGVNDPAVDLGWKRVSFPEAETDWTRREARVYLAPGTNIAFVRCGLLGTGQVLLDDASLTLEDPLPVEPAPLNTNLLADPGFEIQPGGWEFSIPPYPSMRAERDTVVFHSGTCSVRFSGEAGLIRGRAGVAQALSGRAFWGKRLRLTAYVKAESLLASAYLKIFCHTDSLVKQETSASSVGGTMDWKKLVVECDIPKNTYEVWAWIMYTAPTPGTVWIDDASLEVTGPATGASTPVDSDLGVAKPPAQESSKPGRPATTKARPTSRRKP